MVAVPPASPTPGPAARRPPPTVAADRLYAINFRPHELAIHGHAVRFDLQFGVVYDDPAALDTTHYKLLILQARPQPRPKDAPPPGPDDPPERPDLELIKCGWELELTTAEPVPVNDPGEVPGEMRLLLGRIADTVNDLARRAGLEAPLGPDVVEHLLRQANPQGRPPVTP